MDECKVGRTPWSAADAHVGPVLVAAMLLCGAGAFACQPGAPVILSFRRSTGFAQDFGRAAL
jgi:hypothetical protein